MTNDKNARDATVDKLLAAAMAAAPEASAAACLDAGTLAAWADGALDRAELAAAEAHAADCARCQMMLAAMAKIGPAAPAATASWWRLPSLRWLVPLTAAAAAAAIVWFVVPIGDRTVNVRQVSQIAESIPPPGTANAPAADKAPAEAGAPPAGQAAASPTPREQDRRDNGVEADKKELRSKEANAALETPARGAEAARREGSGGGRVRGRDCGSACDRGSCRAGGGKGPGVCRSGNSRGVVEPRQSLADSSGRGRATVGRRRIHLGDAKHRRQRNADGRGLAIAVGVLARRPRRHRPALD